MIQRRAKAAGIMGRGKGGEYNLKRDLESNSLVAPTEITLVA
jgi:hypothetical protein